MWFTPSSIALYSAKALCVPMIIIITSRASITVATPTVKACFGTLLISLPKKRAFASSVSCANVFTLVRDASEEPGSLKAMCPSGPIPPMNSSIPPACLIFSSNASHSATRSGALPSRMCTFSGSMSMCLKKLCHMK
uniref:Putative secreted protein n=1 Tax=Anopheles marajoara TaxID=58244 RepID=A0A2M4C7Q8_9DIPT